jgi:hypothetical protein
VETIMVPFLRMLALAFGLLTSSTAVLADTAADWNDVAMDVAVRSGQRPGQVLRSMAMVHVAKRESGGVDFLGSFFHYFPCTSAKIVLRVAFLRECTFLSVVMS